MVQGGHACSRCMQLHEGIDRKGVHPLQLHSSYTVVAAVGEDLAHSRGLSGRWEWGWKNTTLTLQEAHIGWEERCPKHVHIAV
jgi:hypothetical protein